MWHHKWGQGIRRTTAHGRSLTTTGRRAAVTVRGGLLADPAFNREPLRGAIRPHHHYVRDTSIDGHPPAHQARLRSFDYLTVWSHPDQVERSAYHIRSGSMDDSIHLCMD
jgi:hypothetical protein